MKKIETIHDVFVHELSDMNNAEKQLIKALPKMAGASSNKKLSRVFEVNLKETENQVKLIEKIVKLCNTKLRREKCDAMQGLIKEGSLVIKEVDEGPVRDVMLIAAAQKLKHYEIASYGCLVATAELLGFSEAAELLEQILDQEKQTNEKLNQLAMNEVNNDAQEQQDTTLQKGKTMARYDQDRQGSGNRSRRGGNNMPERDEEGRFMSDDDNRGQREGSRYQDDDYRDERDDRSYSLRSNRNDEYDDDYEDQQFSSDQDDDDYDDNRSSISGGRGEGRGWFGDSEGHSQAARQNRGGRSGRSRSMSRSSGDDDRNGGGGRSRSNRASGQGRGWFGDSEGHAEAGRHSHDNDRGSRSASGGGRSRSSSSSRGSSSRSGGRSSSRGQGHGGWFGDSEGHSEAARQRWEGRR